MADAWSIGKIQPCRVPIDFVVVGEESKLAIGGVRDDVSVAPGGNVELRIAKVDTLSVELILNAGSFALAVASAESSWKPTM